MKHILAFAVFSALSFGQFISQTPLGLQVIGLSTPTAPTVTVSGTAGSTTYTYVIVAKSAAGAYTAASATGSATTGNATLSTTNYLTITWPVVAYAATYDVYRTVGGATQGRIAYSVADTSFIDSGITAVTATAPTVSTAASYVLNGLGGQDCATTTTCSATNIGLNMKLVKGSVALASASPSVATVTGFSPAFTSSTSFVCTVANATTAANSVKVVNASSSSITITGPNTVTDTINYICVGN